MATSENHHPGHPQEDPKVTAALQRLDAAEEWRRYLSGETTEVPHNLDDIPPTPDLAPDLLRGVKPYHPFIANGAMINTPWIRHLFQWIGERLYPRESRPLRRQQEK